MDNVKPNVKPIAESVINNILNKSAYGLPDSPSDSGMSPSEIKAAFYQPLVDNNNSIIYELKRVIIEINDIFKKLKLKDLEQDENFRTVSDEEKADWSAKQDALSFDEEPTLNSQNLVKSGNLKAVLDLKASIASLNDYFKKIDIVDSDSSNSTDKPVSAYQVKKLRDDLTAIQNLLDCDDDSLNSLQEIIAYITDNRDLIESITSSKISFDDIINEFSNIANKPSSAAKVYELKTLIDGLRQDLDEFVEIELDDGTINGDLNWGTAKFDEDGNAIKQTYLKKEDVVDSDSSTSATKPVSANQVRLLKTEINTILSLLNSDDSDLDTIQEIVTFIKNNKSVIDNILTNYYKKTDTVANSTNAVNATNATNATNAGNATNVQGVNLFDSNQSKVGDVIISKKRLIWEGLDSSVNLTNLGGALNRKFEIELKSNLNDRPIISKRIELKQSYASNTFIHDIKYNIGASMNRTLDYFVLVNIYAVVENGMEFITMNSFKLNSNFSITDISNSDSYSCKMCRIYEIIE